MNGALFSMCLVKMPDGANMGPALEGVERFFLVLEGAVIAHAPPGTNRKSLRITSDKSGDCEYMFIPAHVLSMGAQFKAEGATTVLLFEQVYRPSPYAKEKKPEATIGFIDKKPTLDPGAPEVFTLRKLLPLEEAYDFNIHIMDFEPGQSLHCNEMHYNQHGMLILEGQGIYRLGQGEGQWYHLRAGDAVYMAPYCPQWYAALEPGRTRYILYKDTYRDPLLTGSAGAGYKHNVKYQAGV
jgi:(S)-ureidoglycine aminohydrolase